MKGKQEGKRCRKRRCDVRRRELQEQEKKRKITR
jgi:hypothetical protein